MAVTFKDLKLPGGSVVDGSIVLYKAWVEDKTEAFKPKRGKETAMYELNTDKDRYSLSEESAIQEAFRKFVNYDSLREIVTNSVPAEEPGESGSQLSGFPKSLFESLPTAPMPLLDLVENPARLDNIILTIAKIYLHPEVLEESVIVCPDDGRDPTPEEVDPFYDITSGTLYATVGGRMKDIKMSHNRVLTLALDYPGGREFPTITKIDIEEIPLN